MKKWILMMLVGTFIFSLVGCKQRREIIREQGLDKEFAVRNISPSAQGKLAKFFHVEPFQNRWIGEKYVKFLWITNTDELNIASIKFGHIAFYLDETAEAPKVKFVFRDQWLDWVYGAVIRLNRQQYTDLMFLLVEQIDQK